MIRKLLISILCISALSCASIHAQDESADKVLTAEVIATAVDSIQVGYDSEWAELSMEGKLQFDGLPVRPTVKIYMKRNESIIMSARASIFGEVARVEISRDSLTIINKHSKTYLSYPLGKVVDSYPGGIADIQDIMLGEVAIPGKGHMTHELAAACAWAYLEAQDAVLLYPSADLQIPGADYGFLLDPSDWHLLSFALGIPKSAAFLETEYQYGEQGWTMKLNMELKERPYTGMLELTYPNYSPTPLEPTKITDKYRKVDFKNLMKF